MSSSADSMRQGRELLPEQKSELVNLLLERRLRRVERILPLPRTGQDGRVRFPASWSQQRLWFIDQLEGGSVAYHRPMALRLRGALNEQALCDTLDALVQRHEVFRTVFASVDGYAVQEIAPSGCLALLKVDLRDLPEAERDAEVARHKLDDANASFDLSTGPLVRGRLIRLADDEHLLLITLHHIISDGWSIGILLREIAQLYSAHCSGEPDPLPPLPIQYADYAHWQRSRQHAADLDKQLSYWKTHLQGAAPLDLPLDRPRPAVRSHRGGMVETVLSAALTARLKHFAQAQGLTLFMVLYAAWAILLARLSGQEDVSVGTPVANRQRPEVEGLIGFFVNTLVLRLGVRADLPLTQLLAKVKEVTLGAYDHQDVPFERVVEALQPDRSLNRNPLFQVMLVLQNAPREGFTLPGLMVSTEADGYEASMFDLLLVLEEQAGGISVFLNFDTDLLDRQTVERWLASFVLLLTAMTEAVEANVGDLPVLPEEQRHTVIEAFNATQVPYPREKVIHELFEEQVERTPEAVAVIDDGQVLTYAELNRQANIVARDLRRRGIGPDKTVGICLERSAEMVIGVLAALKAGGAYMPLDPQYPRERLEYMVQDAAPEIVLTSASLRAVLPASPASQMLFLRDVLDAAPGSLANLAPAELGLCSRNLLYVIYTSGSTGRPKGTAMPHGSMVNLIEWHRRTFDRNPGTRVLQFAALSFDVAFQEIFSTLSTGGTLVLLQEWLRRDARALLEFLEQKAIGRLFLPPLMLQSLAEAFGSRGGGHNLRLRDVIVAGEQLRISPEIVHLFQTLSGCRLHNHYGPTEAHVVTALTLAGDPAEWPVLPSIGKPIFNTQIYVLDEKRRPVPVGVKGELYIAGANVARGYLGRPELTAQRFVEDPFSSAEARMYRTGDVARWRSDGTLDYLGRNDDQVKIRGYRVELGEVESQLAKYASIREAAVVAREDAPGQKRLVAYVTLRELARLELDAVRAHLQARLPEHMIPSAFVVLEKLPLTPSGKLDRRALPMPQLEAFAVRSYEPPQGELEELIALTWQELLGVERVGRRDNFFELGGHSLLIVQMLERLRRSGLSAPVRAVYESPTVQDLACALAGARSETVQVPPNLIPEQCTSITPEMLTLVRLEASHIERIVQSVPDGAPNIKDIYPLAPLQEGMLFHGLLGNAHADIYTRPLLLQLDSRERVEAFIAAMQKVIDRHDILRTAVVWEGLPQPVQVVYRHATLPVETITLPPTRDPEEELREQMGKRRRIDFTTAPLMRMEVAADPRSSRWYAVLHTHHLIFDNQSMQAMLGEVIAFLGGREAELPDAAPYRDHVARAVAYAQSGEATRFFRDKLADIEEPTAPFGIFDVHGEARPLGHMRELLDGPIAERLRNEARRRRVSAATLFHAAWALAVAGTSGRTDMVIGTVLLGRSMPGANTKCTLGLFINTLPLRLSLQTLTASELIATTQKELIELMNHDQASLALARSSSGIGGSAPLFTALLNYWHSSEALDGEFANATGVKVLASQGGTNYPVVLSVADQGGSFLLDLKTDARIDVSRMMGYVQTALRSLVATLETADQTSALAIEILPEDERRKLESFNATDAYYPQEKLIHELFQDQVRRTPEAIALACGADEMTYRHMNEWCNQLGSFLRKNGVSPGERVAIYMDRGIDAIAAMFGVLKAGGAYVPLETSYPAERIRALLEDAEPVVVLTERSLKARLPPTVARILVVDERRSDIGQEDSCDLSNMGVMSSDVAYVMYTSGSTGQPKGVKVCHRNVTNYAWHVARQFDIESGGGSLVATSLNFDLSLTGVYPPLLCGRPVRVCKDVDDLSQQLLAGANYAPVKLTPTHLGILSLSPERAKNRVRTLVLGGEPLQGSMLRWWRKHSPGTRIFNHYGPTEATIGCVIDEVPADLDGPAPLGRPISNTQIRVLNTHGAQVPIGVTGEIYIAGAGVAEGYWKRPDLTAERFVPDRFGTQPSGRLYRTGDLGRWRSDGRLEFLGRTDSQVKIRGFRVELGEIEARLLRHPALKEAVVVAQEESVGERRLVAYVVPSGDTARSVESLRAHLKVDLPDYMVPSAFVVLSCLPLTANGKLDRRALPAPDQVAADITTYEAPQGDTEHSLATIWQRVLHVERIGRDDDFFALGGHSLHALKLVGAVAECTGVRLPLVAVFQYPTVRQMAAAIEAEKTSEADTEEGVIGAV